MTDLTRIAHRGYAGIAPENTIAATRCAARYDTDYVEIDVMPTGDGDVVVFHDARLDSEGNSRGITDGRGRVWELPTNEVIEAEVLESEESIPRLRTLCAALPRGLGLNVELKHCGRPEVCTGEVLDPAVRDTRRDRWQPFVADVVDALASFDGSVLFSSFAEGALAALRMEAPDAALAPIVGEDLSVAFELADRYDATAIHPSLQLLGVATAAETETPTTTPVERAHDAGYTVNVWTVKTWYQAQALSTLGVDGLIADYPALTAWRATA